MSLQNSSCKTFRLFCPTVDKVSEDEILNINFFSSSQLEYHKQTFNNALCLSGGGSRAFLLSLVFMRELEYINKINNFDIIGSVSGGSWANCMYQYGNYNNRENYLGKSLSPQDITLENVGDVSSECVLSCLNNNIYNDLFISITDQLDGLINGNVKISDLWKNAINKYYLKPFNVSSTKFFVNSESQLNNILNKQPSLNKEDFILPTGKYPLPLFMSTLIGPVSLKPYKTEKNAMYTIFELTSEYTGVYYCPNNGNITYTDEKKNNEKTIQVKGYINSQAFKGILQENKDQVIIENRASILDAISMSSWAPGSFIDSINGLPENFYYEETFINKNGNNDFLYSDGGTINNYGIIPMVQREIKNIFACINTKSKFNYYIDEENNYTTSNIPVQLDFAALFGEITNKDLNNSKKRTYDLTNAQVFNINNFNPLINIMKETEDKGDGILCSIEVETIENKWYNIKAGQKINLTIFYNCLPINWYNLLSTDIQSIVDNKNLPYLPTTLGAISNEDINLISSMTSWTINKYIDKNMS